MAVYLGINEKPTPQSFLSYDERMKHFFSVLLCVQHSQHHPPLGRGPPVVDICSQAFKELNKPAALAAIARETWADAIETGRAVAEPERLLRFLLLTFADLKKSAFLYWFAFPTLGSQALFRLSSRPAPASSVLNLADATLVVRGLAELWARSVESTGRPGCPPFFVVVRRRSGTGGDDDTSGVRILSLLEYEGERGGNRVTEVAGTSDSLFGFVDPCSDPGGMPGWPLRNFLVLLSARWGVKRARVLCFREHVPRASSSGEASAAAGEAAKVDGEWDYAQTAQVCIAGGTVAGEGYLVRGRRVVQGYASSPCLARSERAATEAASLCHELPTTLLGNGQGTV